MALKFTVADFIKSDKADELKINNTFGVDKGKGYGLSKEHIEENMRHLFKKCVQPLKSQFPNLAISSGYRCIELNLALKPPGSSTSNHVFGQAVDLYDPTGEFSSLDIFTWALYNIPDYHQMIWEFPEKEDFINVGYEFSWVHISYIEGNNPKKCTMSSNIDIYN